MGIRHGGDEQFGVGDRHGEGLGRVELPGGRGAERGGLGARWRARLRLQRDQRNGDRDRRTQTRADLARTDRRRVS